MFTALRGLRTFYQIRGDALTAYELGEQMLRLAQRGQDAALLLEAHMALGAALYWLGEFAPAHEHFERVLALYDPQQHRSHAFLYGTDPGVMGYSYMAWTLWYLGYPEQSLQRLQAAIALGRELGHPFSLASALAYAAALYYFRRQARPTQEWAEQTMALSNEHGFPFWLNMTVMLRGWAIAEQGQAAAGIAQLRQGLVTWRVMRTELSRPVFLVVLAQALALAGQLPDGLTALDEALTIVQNNVERSYEAVDVYALKGEFLLAQGGQQETEAAACFQHAIDLARRQGTKIGELRATISLARLWQRQGKGTEARQQLAAIYGWFTEGFDAPDLQAAKALLEELA
jgi:predicted ATPase